FATPPLLLLRLPTPKTCPCLSGPSVAHLWSPLCAGFFFPVLQHPPRFFPPPPLAEWIPFASPPHHPQSVIDMAKRPLLHYETHQVERGNGMLGQLRLGLRQFPIPLMKEGFRGEFGMCFQHSRIPSHSLPPI